MGVLRLQRLSGRQTSKLGEMTLDNHLCQHWLSLCVLCCEAVLEKHQASHISALQDHWTTATAAGFYKQRRNENFQGRKEDFGGFREKHLHIRQR